MTRMTRMARMARPLARMARWLADLADPTFTAISLNNPVYDQHLILKITPCTLKKSAVCM